MSRIYPKYPIPSVGIIILKGNKILLIKRKNSPGRNKWSIPGGVINAGESIEEALIRECKEETNLNCKPICLYDVMEILVYDEKGNVKYHYIVFDFIVEGSGEAKAGSDAADLRLVELDEALNMELTKTTRSLIEKIKREINSNGKPICKLHRTQFFEF